MKVTLIVKVIGVIGTIPKRIVKDLEYLEKRVQVEIIQTLFL